MKENKGHQPKVILDRKIIGANWQQSTLNVPTISNHNGIRLTKHIALDCEMVGIGNKGKKNMLARVSIVNQMGEVLMDKFCKPYHPVSATMNYQ